MVVVKAGGFKTIASILPLIATLGGGAMGNVLNFTRTILI